MARNYSLAEAVDIIVKGEDMEAIADLGRRYPILVAKIAGLAAVAGEKFNDFASYIPEHISANKVNAMIKKAIGGDQDESDDSSEEVEEKPAKKEEEKPAGKKKPAKKEEDDDEEVDYSSMSAPDLFKECKKRGIKAEMKKPAKYYIGLLKKADEATESDEDEWEDTEEADEKKPAKKPAEKKAAEKKPAKKEVKKEAEEEDEDWDI